MRLNDVRTVLLTGPCTDDPWLSVFKQRRSAAFVEVATDSGVVGVGETYAGYFFPESVPLVVEYLKPILLAAEEFEPGGLDVRRLTARMRTCSARTGTPR
jgi:L-alanine-DL-glutamate epimerase-like enolase superfamily enzyme